MSNIRLKLIAYFGEMLEYCFLKDMTLLKMNGTLYQQVVGQYIKRITRLRLGFKNFNSAKSTLAGIELVAMLKKGQMTKSMVGSLPPAEQFDALAA